MPLAERLFIGLSYISPLFTGRGDEVGLGGLPDRTPWQSSTGNGCVGSPLGASLTRREDGPAVRQCLGLAGASRTSCTWACAGAWA